MCGICGVFDYGESGGGVAENVLVRMRDRMVHRGPDGEGLWIAPHRRVGLAHRRLAIVDLSPLAAQPMPNEDETVWITYNGEIYNHAALRRELRAAGHRFRTDHSDTEVVVHAYEQWGADCVERFQGMFAIGIWDDLRRRLFLARDRLGVKPLYVCCRPGVVLFASEIKAILAHPAVSAALSPAALYHYLSFLTAPAPLTMFDGIYKLPAGCHLTIARDGRQTLSRYWDAVPAGHPGLQGLSEAAQEELCVQEIRNLLGLAVEKRMMADVPMGVLLSGGMDSSANVALMSRHSDRPVETFSVGFSDHTYLNELDYSRQVAREYGARAHEVLIGEKDAQEYLPDLIYHQDEPIADWVCIPLYFVSRLARETGTLVVQVGEGSDEQFCGYDHFMRYLRVHRRYWRPFRRLPRLAQSPIAALAGWAAERLGRGAFQADTIDRAARNRELFWGGAIVFWENQKLRLTRKERFRRAPPSVPEGFQSLAPEAFFEPDSFGVIAHYMQECDRVCGDADMLGRMAYLELKLRLPELLLMRVDKISMSTSIEARVPFLDHKLVEFTMGLPMSLKVKGDTPKYLLKKACETILPANIVYRKKMGFGTPMPEWLRGDFGRTVEGVIMDSSLRSEGYFDYEYIADLFRRHRSGRDLSLPLWTLYNVTAWFDRWIAGPQSA